MNLGHCRDPKVPWKTVSDAEFKFCFPSDLIEPRNRKDRRTRVEFLAFLFGWMKLQSELFLFLLSEAFSVIRNAFFKREGTNYAIYFLSMWEGQTGGAEKFSDLMFWLSLWERCVMPSINIHWCSLLELTEMYTRDFCFVPLKAFDWTVANTYRCESPVSLRLPCRTSTV